MVWDFSGSFLFREIGSGFSRLCCPLISLGFDEFGTGNVVVEADLRADFSGCFKESHIASCVHLCVTPGLTHSSF